MTSPTPGFRVRRSSRFQNSIGDDQQAPHDRHDNWLASLTPFAEPRCEGLENGIAAHRRDRRHEEHPANVSIADLGKPRSRDGAPGSKLSGAQTYEGRQGFGVTKFSDLRQLSKDRHSNSFTDARNRRQQVAMAAHGRIVVNQRADLLVNLRDLLLQEPDRRLDRFATSAEPGAPNRLLSWTRISSRAVRRRARRRKRCCNGLGGSQSPGCIAAQKRQLAPRQLCRSSFSTARFGRKT